MDQATLVELEPAKMRRFIEVLDEAELSPSVVAWIVDDHYPSGRLVLAAPALDHLAGTRAYLRVFKVARRAELGDLPTLLILDMADPFIRKLRSLFEKTTTTSAVRLSGQRVGQRFIEEGIAFRIR